MVIDSRLVSGVAAMALRLAVALLAAAGSLVAVAASPAAATATVITVNSVNDPGAGKCNAYECTLREAIAKANSSHGPTTIRFAIGTGPVTIEIGSNLPTITKQVTIDGTTQPGYAGVPVVEITAVGYATSTGLRLTASNSTVRGLVVNQFSDAQVQVSGSGNRILDSYLGTDATGNAVASGGATATVVITGSSTGASIAGNVIGGGGAGVLVEGNATDNQITDNAIGVGADGVSHIGSAGPGISVVASARGTDIRGNRIAFNAGPGIDLGGDGVDSDDSEDGDSGPNGRQNSPVLTTVKPTPDGVDVAGTLDSTPNAAFTIDVYANAACDPSGRGQGEFYLGSLTTSTDEHGSAAFSGVIEPGSNGAPPDDFDD
jgi:CSLREA domain-containing protein